MSPKRLAFSDRDLEDTVAFFDYGLHRLCESGETVAMFHPGKNPDGLCDLLARGMRRFGAIPAFCGAITDYEEAARFCRSEKPMLYLGAAVQMRRLALYAPDLRPRRMLLSTDYVARSAVATIERLLGCQALTHFGITEAGYGCAVEYPEQNGMEIRDGLLVEVADEGDIALTTLRREAMPLIRYKTGDLGVMLPNGNLSAILGRKEHLAQPVSVPQLDEILFSIDDVLDYSAELCGKELTVRIAGKTAEAQTRLTHAFPNLIVRTVADDSVFTDGIHKRSVVITA